MTRLRNARRGQHGGAAVEFALILPVFVAILFGMVDYGWYFYQKFTLASAIREGVRYGATFHKPVVVGYSDPYAMALDEAKKRCDNGSVPSASVTWSGGYVDGPAPSEKLKLHGEFNFKPLVGLVKMPTSTMKYEMTMYLEQQF